MGEVKNADNFERILDSLAEGFGHAERVVVNKAGAEAFEKIMKPKVPYSTKTHSGKSVHLRDSLVTDQHPNGSISVGFTAKSHKGYIGRFQNDGWDVRDRNGVQHGHVPGKHFWEESAKEAQVVLPKTMAIIAKQIIDGKVKP